jgi:hypothetical protein
MDTPSFDDETQLVRCGVAEKWLHANRALAEEHAEREKAQRRETIVLEDPVQSELLDAQNAREYALFPRERRDIMNDIANATPELELPKGILSPRTDEQASAAADAMQQTEADGKFAAALRDAVARGSEDNRLGELLRRSGCKLYNVGVENVKHLDAMICEVAEEDKGMDGWFNMRHPNASQSPTRFLFSARMGSGPCGGPIERCGVQLELLNSYSVGTQYGFSDFENKCRPFTGHMAATANTLERELPGCVNGRLTSCAVHLYDEGCSSARKSGIGAHQDQTPGGSTVNSHIGGTGPVSITTSGEKWFVVYDRDSAKELCRLRMKPGDVFIYSWIADRLFQHAVEKDGSLRNALIYRCAEKNTLFFKESYELAPAQFFGCVVCRRHRRDGLQPDDGGRVVFDACRSIELKKKKKKKKVK